MRKGPAGGCQGISKILLSVFGLSGRRREGGVGGRETVRMRRRNKEEED